MREHGKKLVLGAVRVFGFLFRFLERVFSLFALGDFANGADESSRPARIIEDDTAFFLEPTFSRITYPNRSILDFVMAVATGTQHVAQCLVNDATVVWMDGVQVSRVIRFGAGRQAK